MHSLLIGGASKSPQHGDLSGLVVGDQETLVHVVPLRVATVAETLAIHVAAEVRINAEKENLDRYLFVGMPTKSRLANKMPT